MTKPSSDVLELPLEQRAEMALGAAVKNEMIEDTRLGLPIYV
jgi:hypothetical protein